MNVVVIKSVRIYYNITFMSGPEPILAFIKLLRARLHSMQDYKIIIFYPQRFFLL